MTNIKIIKKVMEYRILEFLQFDINVHSMSSNICTLKYLTKITYTVSVFISWFHTHPWGGGLGGVWWKDSRRRVGVLVVSLTDMSTINLYSFS